MAATFHSRPHTPPDVPWHRLDLRDAERIEAILDTVAPSVVINASIGGADWAVTADGAVRLAKTTARRGIRLVHVSSDAIFSGTDVQYDVTALPDPITPYDAAKATAETAVRLLHPTPVVARTSLIIGDGASAHERIVHELAAGTREGTLFTDDIRCPVHVSDLAAALWELANVRHGRHLPPGWARCPQPPRPRHPHRPTRRHRPRPAVGRPQDGHRPAEGRRPSRQPHFTTPAEHEATRRQGVPPGAYPADGRA